ncbi:hypothetical protein AGDE_00999 [Angomonas deanei]|uniref:Uncharacterized protein n=1 Tax=Angomonas deanei TaxID=59799 RepID=S9VPZ0_9TRYP|nr:hypothetical protein AGDE_03926 [Angomonas deanei]EPY42924.1 hypothetical protein AGDE_00999 [Angomonas deanei]CAD2222411.1 hypothetical protein, conserved [Angomonas deanei]|eukprot:EPY40002.1 hypothetical protein AGDE_03926 [Angomonas deanei]
MRRNVTLRAAGLFATSAIFRDVRQKDVTQRLEAEKYAQEFQMHSMTEHPRSTFEYKSSAKGAEVGARNEAAFMNYEEFTPKTLAGKLAMPNDINLLTVAPIYCVLLCVASAAWGIFYWDIYTRKNYETVLIARPADL